MKHRDAIRKTRPGPAQENAKRRALNVLRQKKLYEQQRDQLYNQQFSVESAANTMQSMQDNVQVVAAMQAGAKEMKSMMKNHKELQVDEVWKTMDQMQDLSADFEEINEAMASYSAPIDVDEDELMGELDALGDDLELGEEVPAYLQDVGELPAAPEGLAAPTAPQGEVPLTAGATDEFGLPAAPQRQ
jgi:charged multivesicular body protein 5